ncbi:hypothetical protein Pmar_PMAR002779 [Perkinsus marinus ATCC 50983]|uniref:Uncharacterized protein n=1 Tax=Perkinsus marinus (strain ATCC 50983 / TXsc) TaxID=423536 RepID=C5KR58_PERM5|nr:hypothetical protein Pmar_PMAR002779 [Perkinsus marinus ATCC 50983]EER13036.1 hypothetical protein Pmar_PMAR002779 [Perkinsus marinus ATCC 50983]|eukprot:XP_002781241.1 hypothetical protein Pmar_PMAR002779 [Perkinsus marinus ATCC 50983]
MRLVTIVSEKLDTDKDNSVTVTITRMGPHFNMKALEALSGGNKEVQEMLKQYVISHSAAELNAGLKPICLNGVSYALKSDVHYSANGAACASWDE